MTETEKLKEAVAAIYRRKGKRTLSGDEIKFTCSMELRWFPPEKAEVFFHNARAAGLLVSREGGYAPAFDVDDRRIKHVIKPDDSIARGSADLVTEIVEFIASSLKQSRSEVLGKINRMKKEMDIETPAAAVLAGLREGLDMKDFALLALDELRRIYSDSG
jgi:hypothetical protein